MFIISLETRSQLGRLVDTWNNNRKGTSINHVRTVTNVIDYYHNPQTNCPRGERGPWSLLKCRLRQLFIIISGRSKPPQLSWYKLMMLWVMNTNAAQNSQRQSGNICWREAAEAAPEGGTNPGTFWLRAPARTERQSALLSTAGLYFPPEVTAIYGT